MPLCAIRHSGARDGERQNLITKYVGLQNIRAFGRYSSVLQFPHCVRLVLPRHRNECSANPHSQEGQMADKDAKPRGRPAKPYPTIPDTFGNVLKALVKPVKKGK